MKNQTNYPIYFVIGTRAQFIKVAPVMRQMLDNGMEYILIYTAQHRENVNEILDVFDLPEPNVVMYERGEANTRSSFLRWFSVILFKILFLPKQFIPKPGILLTHGDTFTAWLGAVLGKMSGCVVGHIESGCRSFNIFSPFPEEISRLITFQFSDIYFCADEWAINNLKRYKGKKINMGANTMLDGVLYALNSSSKNHFDFEDSPFVIVSVHRFENIFTSRFTDVILPTLRDIAKGHFLVFTLHPTTRERIRSLGLQEGLGKNPNISLHERFAFVDWINLCNKAEFVITDGGSNQEELSYLGVPTLLFRSETERQEGLGENVVISKFSKAVIDNFITNIDQYRKQVPKIKAEPSKKIIETILGEIV